MSSLGEVQRIIGLSLSKIQLGRNQRGGLPLHKNLLVATVLNKARDYYMQETMYMNYKMMTGQFGMNYGHQNDEDMDDTPDHEDYDEDSESDVEDECDEEKSSQVQQQLQRLQQSFSAAVTEQQQQQQQQQVVSEPKTSDEGFIDEPDCDCDQLNYSDTSKSSDSRVPFQYCYHCAPFHPSNGRGPTLVPSQSAPQMESKETEQNNLTIYDMDSKSTKRRHPSCEMMSRKRRRVSGGETVCKRKHKEGEEEEEGEKKSLDDSGIENDVKESDIHPAFRPSSPSSSPSTTSLPNSSTEGHSTMEIDQITSLVSIFSFGQQIMAAAAATDPVPSATDTPEEEEEKKDDSDSESDVSSDSGHSSDDKEEDKEEQPVVKLKRSVSTPELCSTSAVSSELPKEQPKLVQVTTV